MAIPVTCQYCDKKFASEYGHKRHYVNVRGLKDLDPKQTWRLKDGICENTFCTFDGLKCTRITNRSRGRGV